MQCCFQHCSDENENNKSESRDSQKTDETQSRVRTLLSGCGNNASAYEKRGGDRMKRIDAYNEKLEKLKKILNMTDVFTTDFDELRFSVDTTNIELLENKLNKLKNVKNELNEIKEIFNDIKKLNVVKINFDKSKHNDDLKISITHNTIELKIGYKLYDTIVAQMKIKTSKTMTEQELKKMQEQEYYKSNYNIIFEFAMQVFSRKIKEIQKRIEYLNEELDD